MRKEVKLGMTIGGGLIALLVVYLLVAPPTQNKAGSGLATGDKGGNIIDPAPNPDSAATTEDKGTTHTLLDNGQPLSQAHVDDTQHVTPPAANENADKPVVEGKAWDKAPNQGQRVKSTPPATPPAVKEPAPKKATSPKLQKHEVTGMASAAPQASEPKLYFNPNDAWGGGVSTDAVFGTEPSHAAKAHTHAAPTETGSAKPEPAAGGATHVIQSGDTLSSIAMAAYGSSAYYPHILRANPTVNPNNLKLGTVLVMPPPDEVKVTSAGAEHGHNAGVAASIAQPDVKIDTTRQYQVQSGDSLYKISLKLYGKSTYVEKIYERNKAVIGSDPKKLKLGMVLELPEKTSVAAAGAGQDKSSDAGEENDRR